MAPLAIGLLTAAVVLAVTGAVVRSDLLRHHERTRAQVSAEASVVASELERSIRERTVLADALAAFVRTDPGFSETEFASFARELLELQPDVRALQLAPGAVIQHVEPLDGNAAALGLDLTSYGPQREVVRRTIEADRFVVGGPLPLVQGGSGMIARLAIYLDDPSADDPFWGLAQVVMDTDAVLGGTSLSTVERDLEIAMRGVDGLGAAGDPFHGDPAAVDDPVLLDIALPGGSWQLAAAPADGWPTWAPSATRATVAGTLVALLTGVMAWTGARRPAELRRRVEEATAEIRAARERTATVMDTASDGILSVDEERRVTDTNPAARELLGREADALHGRRLDELLQAVPDPDGRLTTAVRRPDGVDVPADVTLAWSAAGTVGTVVIRDVTAQEAAKHELERYTRQLERVNDELTRLDALKRDFVGMASHEVRTPITAIRGFSQTLAARWDQMDDDDRRRAFAVIQRQSERLWRLVDGLLVASRLESAPLAPELVACDVPSVLRRVLDEQGIPRGHAVLACPERLDALVARDQLSRIVAAFVHNAHSYGEPPIVVEAALTPGSALRVQVTDHGPGVPAEFRAQLFDPFSQSSTGTRRTAVGAGLGLAVARGLAATAGGRVWYEPAEHGGARFAVELPARRPADDGEPSPDPVP